MERVLRIVLSAMALVAGCETSSGVEVRLLSQTVVPGDPDKVAVEVAVTANCFFSVLVNDELRASGRWAAGPHQVLVPGKLLAPRDNELSIDVAAENGGSDRLSVEVTACEEGELECGGPEPDAGVTPEEDAGEAGVDAAVSEPDAAVPGPHDRLCAPCEGDEDCGGLPNECVFLYPDQPGDCGTWCGTDFQCPAGYNCTLFQDARHSTFLCFPPPPTFECPQG